jgi:hypothetical protein
MQNAIWKLSALAGVVGIGILVMFQVQQGLNQKGGQNADGSKIESTEASSPSANLGAPEQTPGKQNEPALADDAHEGHTHDAGSQDGATAFQASGIDFSKSGAGSAPKLSSKRVVSRAGCKQRGRSVRRAGEARNETKPENPGWRANCRCGGRSLRRRVCRAERRQNHQP